MAFVTLCSCCQSLPPRSHPGCGTQIFRPGREQHMLSLINTGHSFTLLSASSLEVHAFPFILHSYLFSISSCKSFMTSKYGTEIAWTTANPQALLPRSNAALSSLKVSSWNPLYSQMLKTICILPRKNPLVL